MWSESNSGKQRDPLKSFILPVIPFLSQEKFKVNVCFWSVGVNQKAPLRETPGQEATLQLSLQNSTAETTAPPSKASLNSLSLASIKTFCHLLRRSGYFIKPCQLSFLFPSPKNPGSLTVNQHLSRALRKAVAQMSGSLVLWKQGSWLVY